MAVTITENDLKDLSKRITLMNQGKERIAASEICWKFWAYTMQLLHRENRDTGLFQDADYTEVENETNMVEDGLGIEGVSLRCTINKNSAAVEVLFDPDYQISHAVYEHLYARRRMLAEITGLNLRYENFRREYPARIYIVNPEVQLLNIADWRKAAVFFTNASHRLARLFDLFFIVC